MILGLPTISSTKDVCEGCVLGKHHKEKFDKDKPWPSKEKIQLIRSDIHM